MDLVLPWRVCCRGVLADRDAGTSPRKETRDQGRRKVTARPASRALKQRRGQRSALSRRTSPLHRVGQSQQRRARAPGMDVPLSKAGFPMYKSSNSGQVHTLRFRSIAGTYLPRRMRSKCLEQVSFILSNTCSSSHLYRYRYMTIQRKPEVVSVLTKKANYCVILSVLSVLSSRTFLPMECKFAV